MGSIGCSNNNYASREKCKSRGQPKEVAKNARNCNARSFSSILCTLFCRGTRSTVGGLRMNMGMAPNSAFQQSLPLNSTWLLGVPIGMDFKPVLPAVRWWKQMFKKCNASLPSVQLSMVNTKCHRMFPSHGTKRLASEEFYGEGENKRLNEGDINNNFLTVSLTYFISGSINKSTTFIPWAMSILGPRMIDIRPYPYRKWKLHNTLNSQGLVRLPQLTPVPTLLGKGAKQWRDGDWMCTNCSNHNYASITVAVQ
ncbi:hypothetical protein IFM89_010544 [Coptis chinensis]|uniref:Uncharacterized protein n=1 Tax=Coptis chinensis TaxID=261450 RepID=A0A835IY51_9MAGN|nr:hypothetical protein IFM89_010544 [Coptis chinensis]